MIGRIFILAVLAIIATDQAPARPDLDPSRCAVRTFEAEYEASSAVFVGKVVVSEEEGDTKIFTFEVERYWKGIEEEKVKVVVFENPRFQAQFRTGGRFLVFAKDDESYGLADGRCSRSKDLDRFPEGAEADLEKLGPGETFPSQK